MADSDHGVSLTDELLLGVSGKRLWKTLDNILDKVSSLEEQMSRLKSLEDSNKRHDQQLIDHDRKITKQDDQLHRMSLEMARENTGPMKESIEEIKRDLSEIKKMRISESYGKGVRDSKISAGVYIVAWLASIGGAMVLFLWKGK